MVAEDASLDSLDHMNGPVDFFGIETKKANQYLHQKLKVVQTWIFIQGFLIALLVAYATVLGVWLYPFFPMNYENKADDGSPITLASLQRDFRRVAGTETESNETIESLSVWRKQHERQHIGLNNQMERFAQRLAQVRKLDEGFKLMKDEIIALSKQTTHQQKEIRDLASRVKALETNVRTMRASNIKDLDEHHIRLRNLECAKDNMSQSIDHLINATQEQFCNLTREIGNAVGFAHDLDHKLETVIEENITMLEQVMAHQKNRTVAITAALTRTNYREFVTHKWARDKYFEQDELRNSAIEKVRILINTKVGEVKSELDEFVTTAHAKYRDLKEHVTNVTPSFESCFDEKIKVTQKYLGAEIKNLKTHLEGEMSGMQIHFNNDILRLNDSLNTEKTERSEQFVHICEMVDNVLDNATDMYQDAEWKIFESKEKIKALDGRVSHLENIEVEYNETKLEMDKAMKKHLMNYTQFREETIQTDLRLRDRICVVENELDGVGERTFAVETRMNSAEAATQNISFDAQEKIIQSEASTSKEVAQLRAADENMKLAIQRNKDLINQFITDLGFSSLEQLQLALRTTSSNTPTTTPLAMADEETTSSLVK